MFVLSPQVSFSSPLWLWTHYNIGATDICIIWRWFSWRQIQYICLQLNHLQMQISVAPIFVEFERVKATEYLVHLTWIFALDLLCFWRKYSYHGRREGNPSKGCILSVRVLLSPPPVQRPWLPVITPCWTVHQPACVGSPCCSRSQVRLRCLTWLCQSSQ